MDRLHEIKRFSFALAATRESGEPLEYLVIKLHDDIKYVINRLEAAEMAAKAALQVGDKEKLAFEKGFESGYRECLSDASMMKKGTIESIVREKNKEDKNVK